MARCDKKTLSILGRTKKKLTMEKLWNNLHKKGDIYSFKHKLVILFISFEEISRDEKNQAIRTLTNDPYVILSEINENRKTKFNLPTHDLVIEKEKFNEKLSIIDLPILSDEFNSSQIIKDILSESIIGNCNVCTIFYTKYGHAIKPEFSTNVIPYMVILHSHKIPYYFLIGNIGTPLFGGDTQMLEQFMKIKEDGLDILLFNRKWLLGVELIKKHLKQQLAQYHQSTSFVTAPSKMRLEFETESEVLFYREKHFEPFRVYPFPNFHIERNLIVPRFYVNISMFHIISCIRGLLLTHLEDHILQHHFDAHKKLDDVTFDPLHRRQWLSFRYCPICNLTSLNLSEFYYLYPSSLNEKNLFKLQPAYERRYFCKRCFDGVFTKGDAELIKFVDSHVKEDVFEVFTSAYIQKDYEKSLILAKKIINRYLDASLLTSTYSPDLENITLFRFFVVKILKHQLKIKDALEKIDEYKNELKIDIPFQTMFSIRYNIFYSYEGALSLLISGKLVPSQIQFEKVIEDCECLFAKQCLSFTENKERCLKIFMRQLEMKKKVGDRFGFAQICLNISQYYKDCKDWKGKAESYVESAEEELETQKHKLKDLEVKIIESKKEVIKIQMLLESGKRIQKKLERNISTMKTLLIEQKDNECCGSLCDVWLKIIQCYSLNFTAYVIRQQGDRRSCLKMLNIARGHIESNEIIDMIVVNISQHIGVVSFESGRVNDGLDWLKNCLLYLEYFPWLRKLKEVEILQSLAELYMGKGKIHRAYEQIKKPLAHAEITNDDNFSCICWKIYGKILQKMGRHCDSIRILNKSLDICVKYRLSIVDEVLQLIGINFYELANIEKAMKCFEKAMEIAGNNKNDFRIGDMKLSVGKIMIERKKFDEAEKCFTDSKRIGIKYGNLLLMGKSYEFLGVLFYQRAMNYIKNRRQQEISPKVKPNYQHQLDNDVLLEQEVLINKEMEFLTIAFHYFQKALSHYDLLNSLESQMLVLSNQGKIGEKLGKNEFAKQAYLKSINLFVDYFSKLEEASHFLATANSKMIIFSRSINFYYNQTVVNSLSLKRNQLICVQIIEYVKNLVSDQNREISPNFFEQEFIIAPEVTGLNYYVFGKYLIRVFIVKGEIVSIDRKVVNIKEVEEFQSLYDDAIVSHRERVMINSETGDLVIVNPAHAGTVKKLKEKYLMFGKLLFGDLPQELPKKFIIFPHNFLFAFPFACLMVKSDRFLIQDYTFAVSPSITTLQRTRHHCSTLRTDKQGLFMGNPIGVKHTQGLYSVELPLLYKLYGKKGEDLSGENFTFERVHSALSDTKHIDYIHIVSHHCFLQHETEFEDRFKFSGSLELSKGEYLYASKIKTLDLNGIDFVFFNACNSARGGISNIGVLGFFQSFLNAGVKSVICCTSAVQNSFASQVAINFYRDYFSNAKLSKVECLRNSLLQILEKQDAAAFSFLWGGYQLIGVDLEFLDARMDTPKTLVKDANLLTKVKSCNVGDVTNGVYSASDVIELRSNEQYITKFQSVTMTGRGERWERFVFNLSKRGDFFVVVELKVNCNMVYLLLENDVRQFNLRGFQRTGDMLIMTFNKKKKMLDINMWLLNDKIVDRYLEIFHIDDNQKEISQLLSDYSLPETDFGFEYNQSSSLICWMKSDSNVKMSVYRKVKRVETHRSIFRGNVQLLQGQTKILEPKEINLKTGEVSKSSEYETPFLLEREYMKKLVFEMIV